MLFSVQDKNKRLLTFPHVSLWSNILLRPRTPLKEFSTRSNNLRTLDTIARLTYSVNKSFWTQIFSHYSALYHMINYSKTKQSLFKKLIKYSFAIQRSLVDPVKLIYNILRNIIPFTYLILQYFLVVVSPLFPWQWLIKF